MKKKKKKKKLLGSTGFRVENLNDWDFVFCIEVFCYVWRNRKTGQMIFDL